MAKWEGRRLPEGPTEEPPLPPFVRFAASRWRTRRARRAYLPFFGPGFTVSTTWVRGLAWAVRTGVNRPVEALRPIFIGQLLLLEHGVEPPPSLKARVASSSRTMTRAW